MDISESMAVHREIWEMSFSFVKFVTLFGVLTESMDMPEAKKKQIQQADFLPT